MNAFITHGTFDFLKDLPSAYPEIHFFFMGDYSQTVVYYESQNTESVFSSERPFDIVSKSGTLKNEGFIVMNHIPVADDGKALFEDKFKNRQQSIESVDGFQAFRLLRPKEGNTYIALTQWASETAFENWKQSDQFKQAHSKDRSVNSPAYFTGKPYITSYPMLDMEY